MRDILFRGKSMDNGEWVEGSFLLDGEAHRPYDKPNLQFSKCYIAPETDRDNIKTKFSDGSLHLNTQAYHVIPDTVGQFTGLTDKNGKKIFEGDIGRYKQTDGANRNGNPIICTGKVICNAKTASYAVESKDKTGCKYFDYFPIKDFEIIGNIHDNPELLGGAEDGK